MSAAPLFVFFLLVAAVQAFPHQDTCVADFSSQLRIDGFACKNETGLVPEDFWYKVDEKELVVIPGLKFMFLNVFKNPGLNTQGISMSYAKIDVGGVISPHVHPRSSETFSGCCYVGFVSTPHSFRNNTVYGKVLCEVNVGNTSVFAIGAFNHENPGSQNIPRALFQSHPDVPDVILSKAFGLSKAEIRKSREYVSST